LIRVPLEIDLSARFFVVALLVSAPLALAQNVIAAPAVGDLSAKTALPIVFTRTLSAKRAKAGDAVLAKTTQMVHLSGGLVLPAGTRIVGHVVSANPFTYDKTPYARQKPSELVIRFDSAELDSVRLPLHVTLRAMATPIAANDAREPKSSDLDPLGTVTQVGGDLLVPSQKEVVDEQGDVVAYNRHDGVYAHLIANGQCDASDKEVSVGIFSPTACGLYGFGSVSAQTTGSLSKPSEVVLISTHDSPKIWKHTAALLEVLPEVSH